MEEDSGVVVVGLKALERPGTPNIARVKEYSFWQSHILFRNPQIMIGSPELTQLVRSG